MNPEYLKWIKDTNITDLTSIQAKFANLLLSNEELVSMISQPGDFVTIFNSISKYLKN